MRQQIKEIVMEWIWIAMRTALVGAALTVVSGCASEVSVPPLTAAEAASFRAAGNYPDAKYRLEAGDTLSVVFPYHSEMNHDETIRPDGRITMPELGEIEVYGLTTTGVEELLKTRSSTLLKDPDVRVTLLTFAEKEVYVTGEVGKPGAVVYRENLTPLQAVAEAGGLLNTAHVESVVLIRALPTSDRVLSRTLNLQEAIVAGTNEPLALAPRDVLYVPRTAIADADVWVDQHITQIAPWVRGIGTRFPF
jgi:polysaccharide biosynthesis/export protein PslD